MEDFQFLDKDGFTYYSNQIAQILASKLGSKADKDSVPTQDWVTSNFVNKTDYEQYKTEAAEFATAEANRAKQEAMESTYSRAMIDMNFQRKSNTPYVTEQYLEVNGYTTQSWVNGVLSSNYYTQSDINNILDSYYTKPEIDGLIPNLSDYYTKTGVNNLLNNYTLATVTNNLTSQLSSLTSTVSSIIAGGGKEGTDLVDLNNIYYWVHLSPGQMVFHSGETSPSIDPYGYGRCFVTSDMYKRKTESLTLGNYNVRIDADVTVRSDSHDISNLNCIFNTSTTISTFCDQTVKNYLGNVLSISNSGIFWGTELIMNPTSWNNYISRFDGSDKYYLIIDPDTTISGTVTISLMPFIKEESTALDPGDASASEYRYAWVFNYKNSSTDLVDNRQLEIRWYQNEDNLWVNNQTLNSTILSIYNTSTYYDQLKNSGSSYLDDQKYVEGSVQRKDSDMKYYFTYGAGLNMVSILKSQFADVLNAFSDRHVFNADDVPSYSYRIFYSEDGVVSELSPSDMSDITDFITGYLTTDTQPIDPRVSSIYIRNGQNVIYSYSANYPSAHDLFEFVSQQASVRSLGGKRGDITFPVTVPSGEVQFSIDSNNALHGVVSVSGVTAPTGSMSIWPCPDPSNPISAPTGYLLCDGSNYSNTDYASLHGVIGDNYNDSNTPSGYFRVPDTSDLITGMIFIIKS